MKLNVKKSIIAAAAAGSILSAGIGIHTEYERLVTHLVKVGLISDNGYDYNYLTDVLGIAKRSFLEGYENGFYEGMTKYNTVFLWVGNAAYTVKNIFTF